MRKLNVLCCGWGERWSLGTLADNGRDLLFEYSAEALGRHIEFSPRFLKLRPGAFGDFPPYLHRLPGLVADALPDGWGMLLMDRLFRKQGRTPSRVSALERLAFIADRAMGALSFEPPDDQALTAVDLSLLELAKASHTLVQGKDGEVLKQLVLLGGSPHGSRPKALVRYDAATGQVSTLEHDEGSPWLVKFPAQGEHKEVCAIEYVYSELARACGLDMPVTRHFDLDRKLAAFGTERFDRSCGMRVPVHTLAGLLHVDFRLPSVDYGTFLRATRLMTRDESQVRSAFERCVFNVVFHNRDDHAKNFAYRMNRRWEWELAPCYDLTFHGGPGGEHQMAIMGASREPTAADLLRLASDASLPAHWAAQVVEKMADYGGLFEPLASSAPIRAATVKTITRTIEAHRSRLTLARR